MRVVRQLSKRTSGAFAWSNFCSINWENLLALKGRLFQHLAPEFSVYELCSLLWSAFTSSWIIRQQLREETCFLASLGPWAVISSKGYSPHAVSLLLVLPYSSGIPSKENLLTSKVRLHQCLCCRLLLALYNFHLLALQWRPQCHGTTQTDSGTTFFFFFF